MKLFQVIVLLVLASPAMMAKLSNKPAKQSQHRKHTTKKQLKHPQRPNRSPGFGPEDANPALTYALAPEHLHGLLHHQQSQGEAYAVGYDPATLSALISASLQGQGQPEPVVPVEEPEQEEPKVTQAVFHSPKYYKNEEKEPEYKDYAAKYQFGYRVRDLHTGNDFGQVEARDGHYTRGQYHVLLPDGRLQNVQYWSDHSGFHAEVSYNGHAHH